VLDTRAPSGSTTVLSLAVGTGALTALHLDSYSGQLMCGSAAGNITAVDLRSVGAPVGSSADAGHSGAVTALCTAPDGVGVVSAGSDGCVKLWSAARLGRPVSSTIAFTPSTFFNHKLRSGLLSTVGVTDLAVCAGHILASGADGRVLALAHSSAALT
jgi:WD40 repeat protein